MLKSLFIITTLCSSISISSNNMDHIDNAIKLPSNSIAYGDYKTEDYYISDIYSYTYQDTSFFVNYDEVPDHVYTQLSYDYTIMVRYYVNRENFNIYYQLHRLLIQLDTKSSYSFSAINQDGSFNHTLYKSSYGTAYPYFIEFDLETYLNTLQEQDFYNAYFSTLFSLDNYYLTITDNVKLFNSFDYYVDNEDFDMMNLYCEMQLPLIGKYFSASYSNRVEDFPYSSIYNRVYRSYDNQKSYYLTAGGINNTFVRHYTSSNTINTLNAIYNDGELFKANYKSPSNENFTNGYYQGFKDGEKTGYSNGYSNGLNDGIKDNTIFNIFNGILNIAMVPVNFFLSIFNFEILGINMAGFVSALLTISIVIFLLRLIKGSKTDD